MVRLESSCLGLRVPRRRETSRLDEVSSLLQSANILNTRVALEILNLILNSRCNGFLDHFVFLASVIRSFLLVVSLISLLKSLCLQSTLSYMSFILCHWHLSSYKDLLFNDSLLSELSFNLNFNVFLRLFNSLNRGSCLWNRFSLNLIYFN